MGIILLVTLVVITLFSINPFARWRPLSQFAEVSIAVIALLFLLSFLLSAGLDILSVSRTLPSISTDIRTGRWELIRLTPLREGQIIRAKHAAAQLRHWGLTLALISIRGALVVLLLLVTVLAFADSLNFPPIYYDRDEGGVRYVIEFIFLLFQLAGIFAFGSVFLIEPIWRVRGMTALGLAISARVYDGGMATLISAAAILALWVTQLVILFGIFSIMVSFSFFVLYSPVASGFIYFLIFATVVCLAQIGVFYLLQTWALRRVAWQFVRLNQ